MRRAKDCRKCRVRNIFPTQKCSERTAAHTRSAVPALDYLPSRCCFHRLAHGANSSLPSSRAVLMCRGRALPSAGSEASRCSDSAHTPPSPGHLLQGSSNAALEARPDAAPNTSAGDAGAPATDLGSGSDG